jgi:hypothetical protein
MKIGYVFIFSRFNTCDFALWGVIILHNDRDKSTVIVIDNLLYIHFEIMHDFSNRIDYKIVRLQPKLHSIHYNY